VKITENTKWKTAQRDSSCERRLVFTRSHLQKERICKRSDQLSHYNRRKV